MSTRSTVFVTWLLLLLGVVFTTSPADAGGPRRTTVFCGQVITTSIAVANDLNDCPGDALIVGASGITIDLRGHTIDGSEPTGNLGGNGIVVRAPYRHVTVKNGRIRGFSWGIELNGANGGVTGVTVKNVIIEENVIGVEIEFSDDNVVRNVRFVENQANIRVDFSDDTRITGNRFRGGRWGVLVEGDSKGTRIAGNIINGTESSFSRGVQVGEESTDTVVARNRIRGFQEYGISVDTGSNGTTIIGNRVRDNGIHGIYIDNASETDVIRNRASRNTVDGIHITDSATATTVKGNVTNHNGGWGIAAYPDPAEIIDPVRNRARNNGQPEQCLGIDCR